MSQMRELVSRSFGFQSFILSKLKILVQKGLYAIAMTMTDAPLVKVDKHKLLLALLESRKKFQKMLILGFSKPFLRGLFR